MEFEEQCYRPKCAIENSKFVKAFSKTKPDAKIRLFCCHHGGGSFNDFRKWEKMISPDIQVCAIVLPGHIGRMDEPFMTNLHDEAKEIADNIAQFIDRPYAFFGHSFGTMVAYEILSALRRNYDIPPPLAFIESGCVPPDEDVPELIALNLRVKPDPEFVKATCKLLGDTGLEEAYEKNPQMVANMLPIMRSDFIIFEDYQYEDNPPLDTVIICCRGKNDILYSAEKSTHWLRHTCYPEETPDVYEFEGNHFYLTKDATAQELCNVISDQLHDLMYKKCPLYL